MQWLVFSSIYLASLDGAELVPMIPRNRISEAIRINLIFSNRKLLLNLYQPQKKLLQQGVIQQLRGLNFAIF